MATMKDFQKVPDFFVSKSDTKPVNTNSRYPNFFQTHFTGSNPSHTISLAGNVWKTINFNLMKCSLN